MTYAEELLEIVRGAGGNYQFVQCSRPHSDLEYAQFKLALRLRDRKAIAFRAIVENWSRDRLVRELY